MKKVYSLIYIIDALKKVMISIFISIQTITYWICTQMINKQIIIYMAWIVLSRVWLEYDGLKD